MIINIRLIMNNKLTLYNTLYYKMKRYCTVIDLADDLITTVIEIFDLTD